MFKLVVLVAVVASASAGVITSPTLLSASPVIAGNAVAVGPALGATLLGRTTVNAPETTIVKQQVVVDQPEIRYRSVPTIVQSAPVVQQIQTVAAPQVAVARTVVAAPQQQIIQTVAAPQQQIIQTVAAPQQIQTVQTVATPVARTVVAAPQQLVQTVAAPQIATIASPALAVQGNSIQTVATPWSLQSQLVAGVGSQTLLASPTSTLLSSPTVLALKK